MTTIDQEEINKFERMADEWWDEGGKFKPLHIMGPTRINYIKDKIIEHFGQNEPESFSGISIIDIGCGGGLVAHPLAKLGFEVTGIDASNINVEVAITHAKTTGVNVHYMASTAEDYATSGKKHDVVLALEIIEHVADPRLFIESIAKIVSPGGLVIISTINRTAKSYLSAIIGAEYILKWLPAGTHEWTKFLKPGEIYQISDSYGLNCKEIKGISLNPLTYQCKITDDTSVNYFMVLARVNA